VHDDTGQLRPLNAEQQNVIQEIESLSKGRFSFVSQNPWRKNLVRGLPNEWHCGAGGRHLYICENGLVHYCMAQRGYPAIPLGQYTREDIERETKAKKSCAPFCTIFCIQRVALLDEMRESQRRALEKFFPSQEADGGTSIPFPIRVFSALFAPKDSGHRITLLQKTALRILNID
jgi:hypothetical protein